MGTHNLPITGFSYSELFETLVSMDKNKITAYMLSEAFQSKKQQNLGISPNMGGEGGRQKIKKVPSFSWE